MPSQSSCADCSLCQLRDIDISPIEITFAFENGEQTKTGFKGDAQNLLPDVRRNVAQLLFDVVDDNETFVNIDDEFVKDSDKFLLRIKIKNIIEDEQTKVVDYQFKLKWKTEEPVIHSLAAC